MRKVSSLPKGAVVVAVLASLAMPGVATAGELMPRPPRRQPPAIKRLVLWLTDVLAMPRP